LVESGEVASARRCFGRCIRRYPSSSLGYVSLAYLENLEGHFRGAESLYLAAMDAANQTMEAEFNLATLYREWGHLEKAVAHYDALTAKHPNVPVLNEGRARALLQQRRWRDGWEAYEARLLIDDEPAKINLDLPVPRWQGESLADKHLLILYEQGIGDEVQFASCYSNAIAKSRRCTVTCSPRLLAVFQRSFPQANFIAVRAEQRETWKPEDPSLFDFVVPAGSLPRHFRCNDGDFPGKAYLVALGNSADAIHSVDARLRVGVSWWGGAVADQIQKRSIPFDVFEKLFMREDVSFVNLQHGCCDEKAREQLQRFDNLHTLGIDPYRDLDSWFDLIASLDLIISVDNSNVHFAGSLGVPTWLLLADHPNWRWPRGCDVAPWYSCVRLIRKTPSQDWNSVVRGVSQRLASDRQRRAS
jgi:hypothetical protein